MDENIKVKFTGDASSLNTASKQATDAFDNVSKSSAKVSQSLSQSSAQIAKNAAVLGGSVKKGSNEAMQSLTNLSRVAQDAPYGFIGIANNINPLLESFQRLKASTGTTGGALKALGSSLIGGGGLGLAVGVVSSLMVVFGDKIFGASKKTEEAKQKIDAYGESVKEAFKGVADEAAKVEVLVAALKAGNLTYAERKGAIEELKRISPSYFAQLDEEKLNIDTLNLSYKNYLKSLQNAAEAKVLEKQLEGIIEKRLELEKVLNPPQFTFDEKGNRIQNFILETTKTQKIRNQNQAEYNNLLRGEDVLANRLAQLKPKDIIVPDIKEEKKKGDKAKTEFLFDFLPFDPSGKLKPEQRGDLLKAIDSFQKEFGAIIQGAIFTGTEDQRIQQAKTLDLHIKLGHVKFNTDSLKEAFEKLNKDSDIIPQDGLEGISKEVVDQFIRGFQNESERLKDLHLFSGLDLDPSKDLGKQIDLFKTRLKQFGAAIPRTIEGVGLQGQPIEISLDDLIDTSKISNGDALEAIKRSLEGIKAQVFDLGKEINKALNDALANISTEGLSSIGEAIGAALGGGDIANVFRSFEQTLGSAVQSLGKQIIALNVAALAAKKALKLTFANPAIGIAAGVALVAVGSALKALTSGGIKGFAKGGLVPGSGSGDTVPAMLTPGEFVVTKRFAPLAQLLFGGGFKMPRITNGMMGFASGGLVTSRTIDNNNAVASPVSFPDYLPVINLSYDQLRIMYQRAGKQRSIFGG
jgi:hypothetical protein